MIRFGDAAMPILGSIGSFLADGNFMAFFADQLAKSLPQLSALTSGVLNLLPAVLALSHGFLFVISSITKALGIFISLLNTFPVLTSAVGAVAGGILTLATVTSFYTIIVKGAILSSIKLVGQLAIQAAAYLANSFAALTFASSLALVISMTLIGIVVVGALAAKFSGLSDQIKSAREQLEQFKNVQSQSMGGVGTELGSTTGIGGGGDGNSYTTIINAGDRDDAARQQYSSGYERRQSQHVDSIFGG